MLSKKKKTIWIDLDNSPHVPFFKPITQELNQRGYQVQFTVRDCFQVCALADLLGLTYKKVGRHYGKNKFMKVAGTLIRAAQLLPTGLKIKPLLTVSHGSRSQIIASTLLCVPHALIFDYEHVKTIPLIKPAFGIAPDVIDKRNMQKEFSMGFKGYAGLKEDVYVASFKPNPAVPEILDISPEQMIITIRPPATEAHYHNPESERLFFETVERIGSFHDSVMIILPRNEHSQRQMILDTWPHWCRDRKIIVPKQVLNGLELIWCSDFVISGGGTMNREAAALNVPVFSIFRGTIGAVDQYLSDSGRLTLIQSVDDIHHKIHPIRRTKNKDPDFKNLTALKQIVDAIDEFAQAVHVKCHFQR